MFICEQLYMFSTKKFFLKLIFFKTIFKMLEENTNTEVLKVNSTNDFERLLFVFISRILFLNLR